MEGKGSLFILSPKDHADSSTQLIAAETLKSWFIPTGKQKCLHEL